MTSKEKDDDDRLKRVIREIASEAYLNEYRESWVINVDLFFLSFTNSDMNAVFHRAILMV